MSAKKTCQFTSKLRFSFIKFFRMKAMSNDLAVFIRANNLNPYYERPYGIWFERAIKNYLKKWDRGPWLCES